jgi:hypothetical protein
MGRLKDFLMDVEERFYLYKDRHTKEEVIKLIRRDFGYYGARHAEQLFKNLEEGDDNGDS